MNHDDDNDIARLFAQFGGDPGTYQEIASVAAAREARARWPLLSAIDPLAKAGTPAMGADDKAAVAHAMPSSTSAREADSVDQAVSVEQADELDAPVHRAQFIAPRRNTFSHDVPAAFLVPVVPVAPVDEIAAPTHEPADDGAIAAAAPLIGSRIEPTIDAAPTSITTPAAMPTPTHAAALDPASEPTPEAASSPSAADPFRRLAARPAAENESQRLPDLFKRLLSS